MTIADTVNAWYRQHLASGPIARNTEAYNQLTAALPALIADLDASAPPPPEAAAATAPSIELEHEADDPDAHHDA